MVDDKPAPSPEAGSDGSDKVPPAGQDELAAKKGAWSRVQKLVTGPHSKRFGLAFAVVIFLYNLKEFSRLSRYCLFDSTDTGWLVRTGQYICQNMALPQTDIFSWTCADKSWVVYQWLAEAVMWSVYDRGGLWLIGAAWLTMVALLYFWLLPRLFLRRGVPLAMAFFCLALVLTPAWFFARPQTFSFFFLLAFQAILEYYKSSGKWKVLIALPPLMILWANTHSFWFIGLLMLLCYCVDGPEDKKLVSLDRSLLFCCVISALCLLVNPYGLGLIEYNISFIGNTPDAISEVRPVELPKHAGFVIYIVLFILACLRNFSKIGWGRAFLATFLLVGATQVRRFEPVAVIVTFQYMAMLVESQLQLQSAQKSIPLSSAREFARGRSTNKIDLMLLTCALLAGFKIWSTTCPDAAWAEAYFRGARTGEALAWYEKNRTGKERVFCDADTGDWLILHKAGKVFIDTRFDFYGKNFFYEWYSCMEGTPGWDKYLERHGVTHVILRGNPNLAKLLEYDQSWQKVADDKKFRIWAKNSTPEAK